MKTKVIQNECVVPAFPAALPLGGHGDNGLPGELFVRAAAAHPRPRPPIVRC